MKILENMDLCYGCAACANVCRPGAITMEKAEDGFLYPVIDDIKCVGCNACKSVCPALQAKFDNEEAPEVYAVMAEDSIREKSASGGMFTILADYALEKGAYICGSAFDDDFKGAHHIMISSSDELDKLRRSKYMQSENGDIHKKVKEKLDAGEFVMFTGTPCQCASIRTFLKKPYENLLLVDLICHGTPSPLAWNKFLEETAPNKAIKDVNFRYKGLKGWSVTTHIEFEDGTEYTKHSKEDLFEQAATKNFISRKSCGSCQFARVPRQADLSIGDFWDIHKYKKISMTARVPPLSSSTMKRVKGSLKRSLRETRESSNTSPFPSIPLLQDAIRTYTVSRPLTPEEIASLRLLMRERNSHRHLPMLKEFVMTLCFSAFGTAEITAPCLLISRSINSLRTRDITVSLPIFPIIFGQTAFTTEILSPCLANSA